MGIFKDQKGSMALEGAMAVPLFIFFICTLMMGLEAVRLQSNVFESICEGTSSEYDNEGNGRASVCASEYLNDQTNAYLCVKGGAGKVDISEEAGLPDGYICLRSSYAIKPFAGFMPIGDIRINDRILMHTFSGYSGELGSFEKTVEEEYVYITETGSKYHLSPECTHIKIVPQTVSAKDIDALRNSSGGKYHRCERCHPNLSGTLFITKDGDRYHCDQNCSGLKRTVYLIPLSEALDRGYSACSKCG